MPPPSHFTAYRYRPDQERYMELRETLFPADFRDDGTATAMVDARASDLESSITVRMDMDLRGYVRAVATSFGLKDAELIRRLCYSAFGLSSEFVAVEPQPEAADADA